MRRFAAQLLPQLMPLSMILAFAACATDTPPPAADAGPVSVLVTGSQFRGANGILFGPDGKLYIASVVTPVIAVMDPDTGAIEERFDLDDGVQGPDDLAFGPDGSLFWTDIAIGTVGRRRPDGTTQVVADIGPGPNPITFSDDGRLFVSQCFFDDRLWEIDPEGVEEPRLINDELGPGCGLNGMDWGPDGYLYGPRWFRGEVVRVDVETGTIETVADGFGTPAAVKFDSQGRLHVLDTLAGEIVRVHNGEREIVGRVQPSSADNLAFDEDDRLFVSSFADGFIVEVLDPQQVRTVSAGGLNMPGGLALDSRAGNERLWVADFFALRALDPESGAEIDAERDVIGVSELGSSMTVSLMGDNLILTTWFDNQVKIWDPQAREIIARFEGFAAPLDALVFGDGIAVAELGTGSVLLFDPSSPDERQVVADGLGAPAGLAAHDGDLYVTDNAGGRLLQVAAAGEPLEEPREVATGLVRPEGVDIGADGALYVVEAEAGRVTRIDPESGATEVVAEDLELQVPSQGAFPHTMLFNGIAVGTDRLFVTGDRANLIYEIEL